MSSAPDVYIDGDEVVFGPWEDWQGDYTALKVCDLLDFIESLERLPVLRPLKVRAEDIEPQSCIPLSTRINAARRFHGVSDTNPQ